MALIQDNHHCLFRTYKHSNLDRKRRTYRNIYEGNKVSVVEKSQVTGPLLPSNGALAIVGRGHWPPGLIMW